MKKFNCDFFQIAIEFDEKHFKRKEFVLDVKPSKKEEAFFSYSFGSKTKSRKEHAHLFISLDGKESVIQLGYIAEKGEGEDVREPYLEDIGSWLAQFITEKTLAANITVVFLYSQKKYESLLQLDYPLLIGNSLLKGAKVTGHEISFADDELVDEADISVTTKSILVYLTSKIEVDFAEFNLYEAIKKLSKYATALVKNKEDSNEGTK